VARFPLFYRFLRAALFEDWALKFICLAFAILMWFYIDGELSGQIDLVVAMRPSDFNLPANLELAPDSPLPKLRVIVRGPRNRLQLISPENISMRKKQLDNPQAGHNVINFLPSDAEAEANFDIISITPKDSPEAAVDLVEIVSKPKAVLVKHHGEPRAGFLIGKWRCDPDKVNIEGPIDDIDRIQNVTTEDLDVTDLDQDLVREVGIVQTTEVAGRVISFRCGQRVRVTIPIRPPEATRVMSFDIRSFAPDGIAMQVEPKTVEVEVVGDDQDLTAPDIQSKILLYVEWPGTLDRPKDPGVSVGPHPVKLQWVAPSRVQVRGVKGAALPSVNVKAALASALKPPAPAPSPAPAPNK
jgi:hypothetical protein